jgi:DNA-binding NarL/FixJ family response regulator
MARERGFEFAQARLLAQLGYIYFSQGRLNEARSVAEQSVALAEPGNIAAIGAMTTLADVLSQQGEYTAALAIFDQVAPNIERADPDLQAGFLSQRARPLAGLGRLDEAAAAVRRGVDLYLQGQPGGGITTFLIAGEIFEARRDASEIRRLIADADQHFSGNDTATVRVLRHELAAILIRCEGGDAASSFSRVADEYEALGVPLRAAHRRATAAILRLADPVTRASARRELASIRAELVARGALRYVAAIDAASRPRAVPAPRTQAGGALSDRDVEVALLVSRGLTDRAIAFELGVTQTRAAALVRAVLVRLGVARRSQVAGWVIQRLGAEMGGAAATR